MRLAICARGDKMESEVDQRFGRCPYFVIVDTDRGEVLKALENSAVGASGGAGPQAAQQLSNEKVEAVALGNVGPNAAGALEAAKIKIYGGVEGTVADSLKKFNDGQLEIISGATVESHSGMKNNS